MHPNPARELLGEVAGHSYVGFAYARQSCQSSGLGNDLGHSGDNRNYLQRFLNSLGHEMVTLSPASPQGCGNLGGRVMASNRPGTGPEQEQEIAAGREVQGWDCHRSKAHRNAGTVSHFGQSSGQVDLRLQGHLQL